MESTPLTDLRGMDVDALMSLRADVDRHLGMRRQDLERQLASLRGFGGRQESSSVRRGVLKGSKVAPKFRGPAGETWAGRGATPRWLVAALKGGAGREDFLIEKPRAKSRAAKKK